MHIDFLSSKRCFAKASAKAVMLERARAKGKIATAKGTRRLSRKGCRNTKLFPTGFRHCSYVIFVVSLYGDTF